VEIVVAQPAERIGDFDILDFGTEPATVADDGHLTFRRWWKLVTWSPGTYTLTTPDVTYRRSGEELTIAEPVEITVEVPSLIGESIEEIELKDIKPPMALPVDRRPYYAAAVLAALGFCAWLGRRWSKSRHRRRPFAPPPPPHVVAAAALDALRARNLVERGAFKEFYSALADIVRMYMEGRYGLRAPEMTTEEFLTATAKDFRLAVPHQRLLASFLSECDLVKFARHRPARNDSDNAFAAARRFVDETIESPLETQRAAG
jgi:hypothetical protein